MERGDKELADPPLKALDDRRSDLYTGLLVTGDLLEEQRRH